MTEIKLFNGSCLEKLKCIPDDSVDLVLTDPPYNLANFMQDRSTNLTAMRPNFFGSAGWDEFGPEEWEEAMDLSFREWGRVVKSRGSTIIFMSLMCMETLIRIAQRNGFYYKTIGIWHKRNPMPRNMNLNFINSVEGWLYLINIKGTSRRSGIFNNEGAAVHDHIETGLTPSSESVHGRHPTQKPEGTFEWFVRLLTNPGDTVMDPFMGSGTAAAVSKWMGRNFIGIELNARYYEMTKRRLADISKADCTLLEEER